MAALTTLNITEKNANNSLSVTVKVNITKKRSVYHYFIKRRCGQDKTGACVQHRPLHDFREIC